MRVLVAEDNQLNQEVIRELLKEVDVDVTIVQNGLEAFNILQKQDFDLVFMDIQMPVMDGYQAVEKIRQSGRKNSRIPIIAMTAHALKEELERCIQSGMNSTVTKPVDPELLYQVMMQWYHSELTSQTGTKMSNPVPVVNPPLPEVTGDWIDHLKGFDTAYALRQINGNRDLYRKVIRFFYEQYGQFAEKVEQACQKNDYPEVKNILHSIKGSLGNLGALELRDCVIRFETAIKNQDTDQYPVLLEEFMRIFAKNFETVSETVRLYMND
jgi:CheY-like chemotaxis protein/HPt (histidine-containing phosphotransfer) domain-containing protein